MTINQRLKIFLEKNNISQATLGQNINVSRQSVNKWIGSANEHIRSRHLIKIFEIYRQLNPHWLLFGDGDMYIHGLNKNDFDEVGITNINEPTVMYKKEDCLGCEAKDAIIRSKEEIIQSKNEIIKTKDEFIRGQQETIELLKNKDVDDEIQEASHVG